MNNILLLKLFLVSSFADVSHLLPQFANEPFAGKRITFIPTASIHEEVTHYVDEGKQALLNLGLKIDVLEVSTATHEEIVAKITENDYLYISGGNTFFLLQELKRTGADLLMKQQIEQGKLYIGESAGAMIMAPNIGYASMMDQRTSQGNDDALNIVDFYPLPHYKSEPFEELVDEIINQYSSKIKLCPMTNKQAIGVEGEIGHQKTSILQ